MLTFPPSPQVRIFVAREPVDMRRGFDALEGLIIDALDHDPQSGHLFLFFNRGRNRVKIMAWETSGYWILYKRLEHGRFAIFDRADGTNGRFTVTSSELSLLLDGIDLRGSGRRLTHDDLTSKL